jgi:hypothetical protein
MNTTATTSNSNVFRMTAWTTTTWTDDQTCMQVSTHFPAPAPKKPKFVPTYERDVLAACTLYWWRIRGYCNDYDENGRRVRSVDSRYEGKGWLGLTVSDASDHEVFAIKKWVKSKGKDAVYLSKKDYTDGEPWVVHFIGSYQDFCLNLWFSTEDLMLEFVELLKSFPVRTKVMAVKNIKAAMQFIKGTNYMVLVGEEATALALTDEIDEVDFTLLRLAAV